MAITDFATSYAAIIKQEKQDDGTLLVYGKATDDALDIDNQICDASWLEKAMPEWFKSGGNIREQHSNIAAGVAKELDSKADGHYISALVVDPTSVKKVETGVLKGFSIGIRAPRIVRDTKAANGRIIDGTIVEVSLVDRPANPNAKLMLAKSNGIEVVQVEEMIEEVIEAPVEVLERAILPEIVAEVTEEVDKEKRAYGESAEAETAEGSSDSAAEEVAEAKVIGAECDCDGCVGCKADGGCKSSPCNLCMMDKSAESNKCLECGCHAPQETHGRADVSTAEMVSPEETPKSDEAEVEKSPIIPRIGINGEDFSDDDTEEDSEQSDKSALSDDAISAIIEKAVKSATDTVRSEIELLKSAKEADSEVINKLESELATANSKAASGGPKRATLKPFTAGVSDFINKAAEYRAKSASTSDPILAKGWKEMAQDFESKAQELNQN